MSLQLYLVFNDVRICMRLSAFNACEMKFNEAKEVRADDRVKASITISNKLNIN